MTGGALPSAGPLPIHPEAGILLGYAQGAMTQSNGGNGPQQGGARPAPATSEMTMPEPKSKPAVSPTVIDDVPAGPAPATPAQPGEGEAPWARPGMTQPGEPPLMADMAPPAVAQPPAQPAGAFPPPRGMPPGPPANVPYVAAPQPPSPMVPHYPPMGMPPRRRSRGGSLLLVGSLLGLLGVIAVVAGVVLVVRPGQSEEPAQTIDVGVNPHTEVKPEVAADPPATTAEPAPAPTPAPIPQPVVHTTPKRAPTATTTAQPTATTTATTTTQPTTTATTAPSATSTGAGRLHLPGRLKLPKITQPPKTAPSSTTGGGGLHLPPR